MVVGDAESLASDKNSGIVEYLEASLVQPNSSWQLLDFRDGYWDSASVASNYLITITDKGRRFVDSMKGWNANESVQAVMYAKNAYSLRQVKSRGQGITAVAVGIVAPFDFGDALASFGNAGSYMGTVNYNTLPDLTDGLYTAVNMPQIYITPYTNLYLGTNNTDPDGTPSYSNSATYDNVHANNDEDGFNLATQPIIGVNNNTNVKFIVKASNKGNTNATVYGWVDFNRDSLFSANESAVATLPAGTIDSSIELVFNYNNYKNSIKMGPTYARFRVTTTPLIDSVSTLVDERSINIALDGETEDYKLNDIVLGKALPVGVKDIDSTPINKSVTTNVKANDGAINANDTVKIYTQPLNGTVVIDNKGKVVYTPNPNYTGKDVYYYTITNLDTSTSTPIMVTIFVKPVGINDSAIIQMNNSIHINVKANDSANGLNDTLAILAPPKNGVAVVKPDGTIFYNPNTDFSGNDTLTYTLMSGDSVFSTPVYVYLTIVKHKADVVIKKLLNTSGKYYSGKSVDFLLIITNNGPDSATGVIALDTLPSNLGIATNFTTNYGSATYNPSSSSVSWNVGVLPKNQIDTLTFSTQIISGSSLTNTAFVKGKEADTDTSNNRSTITPMIIVPIPTGVMDIDSTNINNPITINVKANDGTPAKLDSITVATPPNNGKAIVNKDSTVTYQPSPGFAGKDSFTYTLYSPDSLVSKPVTVTILVKPVGITDVDSTPMNTGIKIFVKANDSAKGLNDTLAILNPPKNGVAIVKSDGTIFYTPKTDFVGNDTLTYTLMTGDSVFSSPIFVYITVFKAKADVVITKLLNTKGKYVIGKSVEFSLVITNNGPDSATAVVAFDTLANNLGVPSNLTTKNGSANYIPSSSSINWNVGVLHKNEIDTLTFTTQIISGTAINNAANIEGKELDPDTSNNRSTINAIIVLIPTGVKDIDSTNINNPITINVKVNDGIPAKLDSVTVATPPINGTAIVNKDSTVTYKPNPGFVGKDSFTYTLFSPDSLVSKPVTVTIFVKPIGVTDLDSTPMNMGIKIYVKSNDSAKGVNDTLALFSQPKNGTATVKPDGTIYYTPKTDYVGNDTLTYTLMTVDSIFSAPIFVYITVYKSKADIVITKLLNTKGKDFIGKSVDFSLIVTNNGPDSATSVVALDTLAINLSSATNLTTNYGNANYNATSKTISWNVGVLHKNQIDTLTFTSQILNGNSLTNTAFITGKELDPDTSNNRSAINAIIVPIPTGIKDMDSTPINQPIIVNVKANDGIPAKLDSVTVATPPINGTAIVNKDSTVTYIPKPGFSGKDSFTYTLFSPDSIVSKPVTVTIFVKPVGVTDIDTTPMNTGIKIFVKGNDSAKGVNDTLALFSQPKNGTAIVKSDGTIYYTPKTDFVGNDTLTYTLMTGDSVFSTPVYVYLTIIRPRADIVINKILNTKGTLIVGKTVEFSLVVVNNGPDSATGIVALDTLSSNLGIATNIKTAHGIAAYLPASTSISWKIDKLLKNQKDTLKFSTTINSGTSLINTAIVNADQIDPDTSNNHSSITPKNIYPIPTGVRDNDTTIMNMPVVTNVKANDGTPAIVDTVKVVQTPNNGKTTVNIDGTIAYQPNTGFNGKDTFTYQLISPDSVVSAPIRVIIVVKPIGVNDLDSTTINKPVTTTVKANDGLAVSIDTVKIASTPVNGTVTVDNKGHVTYTPNTGYTGKDVYTYTLTTPDSVISSPITSVVYVKPVGVLDRDSTPMNIPIKINVKNNDSAKGGNNIVVINSKPKNGLITINQDSTITYTPNLGYYGKDTCTYLLMTSDSVFSTPISVYLKVYQPKADVSIVKVLNTALPIVIGQRVAFTLTITNNGPDSASGIVALDTLAFNLGVATNIIASNGNATFNNFTSALVWNIGGLGATKSATLTFSSSVLGGTSFVNSAKVIANESDPDTTNNRSTIPVVQFATAPKGIVDYDTTTVNTPVFINVKANDGISEINDTVKVVNLPANAIAIVNNGNVIYTPNNAFLGKDSLTYTLTNASGLVSPPIKVYILVLPTGVNDKDTTEENTPVTTAIIKNDGPSTTQASPVLSSPPSKGKVIFNGNGTVTYVPDSSFVGVDTYQYELVTKNGLTSAPITVTITVIPPIPKSCDLEIVKELTTTGSLYVSETVNFSITVTNNGPNDATGIVAEDFYPKNLSKPKNISATVGFATYVDSSKAIIWDIGGLASGQVSILTFSAVIDSGTVLNNSAAVLGKQPDPDLTNNHSSIQQKEIFPFNLVVPNVITPNGDGKNDKFIITGLGRYPNSEISIFNRWDNMVYHSSDYNNDWDGSGLNTGTYYYVLKLLLPSGNYEIKKGWVMLLR